MKKNVLLLLNGFGIEQSDSSDIYSAEIMPNMDRLSKEKIFEALPNNFLDYESAYRNLSMGVNEPLTFSLIDNNINNVEYPENQLLLYIINELNKNESNLHLFCYWESEKVIEQVITYVNEIQSKIKGKIFLHFVLCDKSVNDYKKILDGLNKLNYSFIQNVKIGLITGINTISEPLAFKELMKSWITEVGEKWKDFGKKIDVCVQTKVQPCNIRSFAVNYGYRIEEKDQIMFFNYSIQNVTNFKKELIDQRYRKFDVNTLGFYSLFPVKSDVQIPFMYNYALSANYSLACLNEINARCLILDTKDKCPVINYYMTGLRNEISENLKYLPTDDGFIYDAAKLIETFKKYDKELIIINYEINSCKTVEEVIERLKKIDVIIGEIEKYTNEINGGFFISSLYGLETQLYNAKSELKKINLYSKVPVIICDNSIDMSKYSLNEGSLYDLFNTILFNINNSYKNAGLLSKKSGLFSFLFKKPKKSEKHDTIDYGEVKENEKQTNS